MMVTWSMVGVFVWIITASLAASLPSKRAHWPTAYVLITIGIPLLVWVYVQNGLVLTLLSLAAGMSILRWPVRYLIRWVRRVLLRQKKAQP